MTKQDLKKLQAAVENMPVALRAKAKRQLAAALRDASTIDDFRAIVLDPRRTSASRARALWVLRVLNDRTIRTRLPMLFTQGSNSSVFSWEVAKSIVALRPPGVVPILLDMLDKGAASSREQAAWLLGLIGGSTSRRSLELALASDEDPAVRAQAAEALGTLASKQAVPALVAALRCDRSARVRHSVVHALSGIGDRTALTALREGLRSSDGANATSVGAALRRAIRKLQKG